MICVAHQCCITFTGAQLKGFEIPGKAVIAHENAVIWPPAAPGSKIRYLPAIPRIKGSTLITQHADSAIYSILNTAARIQMNSGYIWAFLTRNNGQNLIVCIVDHSSCRWYDIPSQMTRKTDSAWHLFSDNPVQRHWNKVESDIVQINVLNQLLTKKEWT